MSYKPVLPCTKVGFQRNTQSTGVLHLFCDNLSYHLQLAKQHIESYTKEKNVPVIGKIPFDPMVMEAVNSLRPITEMEGSIAKTAIEKMWILLEGAITKKALQKEHK